MPVSQAALVDKPATSNGDLEQIRHFWSEIPEIVPMMAVSQASLVQKLVASNGDLQTDEIDICELGFLPLF
ncbi:uncharacterized protein TrAtP1_007639 [Trichoderma atroviride]|uniref:uncharacterized protein n=1 Tax=Hypocrea atroviridis TaxID=63577 RepID=UPI00331D30DC|nr:hypothetical protein TrAtP1_007639 [Trichoderma atroviride]